MNNPETLLLTILVTVVVVIGLVIAWIFPPAPIQTLVLVTLVALGALGYLWVSRTN